ncbi:MAG: uracil-DNA glycosylase family protein, partial [Roseobacter sp.]|nr:uracil-DNA glycosylase family protein [Roseobacter sp.]
EAYVTNAVKHFKFVPRGRRRIHQKPDAGEVQQCRWWLQAEIAKVRPDLIVALGATAALALTGSGANIMERRGRIVQGRDGFPVLVTLHPAYILRLPQGDRRREALDWLTQDLARAGVLQNALQRPESTRQAV